LTLEADILATVVGTTVSHYRVTGKLGVGGMGVVYEALDTHLARPVALKFLPQELANDPDASRRLRREAQTLAGLNHHNVCAVYDIGQHEGAAFVVMERCDGVNLKIHMARATLSTAQIVDIASQVTAALEAAHTAGVVHRDIKPGNIMVGTAGQVKVLDFGLARRFTLDDTGEPGLAGSTILGRPLGTANYMAPERILQLPLDPRSDLFSLGVVIYEMATGRLPFAGEFPSETVTNVLEKDPIPVRTHSPDRPIRIEQIVTRLLAKGAENRYQSATDLRKDLGALTTPKSTWRRLLGR
jgi:serine/threonine protein kinase